MSRASRLAGMAAVAWAAGCGGSGQDAAHETWFDDATSTSLALASWERSGSPTEPGMHDSRTRLFETGHSLRAAGEARFRQGIAPEQPCHRLPGEAALRAAAQPWSRCT